jgi:GT2 family glycosyltransferase
MDARVPAVVAVVVTRDPGPWFEETLTSLADQRYDELDVLVLVAGGDEDPTARVGRVLPEAFVRRLPDPVGYSSAANAVLGMVEGAAYYLFCTDDCALEPDSVRALVQESFRSNAGIVTPKMVRWDAPQVLVHVGLNADKTGATVDRMQAGERDHGQHDAVRDVFVAPTGCTLVRADLFAELGGFDSGIDALGEDLDLSWRAQVMGARVVIAPDARVRCLQVSSATFARAAGSADGGTSPQALQRRHELRAMLKAYGWFHLLRVLPQAVVLGAGEMLAALVAGDRGRVRAVAGAWRWNLARIGELRTQRKILRTRRAVSDADVRRLQLRGSARLSTYFSRLAHQGFDVAHGRAPATVDGTPTEERDGGPGAPVLTGSVGGAFSEDADFDELDDMGRRAGRDRFGRRPIRRVLASPRSRVLAGVVIALVLVFGSRDLLAGGFPLIGQLVPLGTWSGVWHHLVSGWQPAGLGSTAPASPAFAVLGGAGTVLLGGMGLVQKVLVLGCIPLGAWGVARLLRPLVSARARFVGALCYLGLPLPYDDLAHGRWDGLVAYAAVPFLLSRLARSTGLPPFAPAPADGEARRWRDGPLGQIVVLGVVEAVAMSFAPAVIIVVPVSAAAIVAGSLVVGEWRGSVRALGVAGASTAVALVLCGPWVVGVLSSGDPLAVLGLPAAPAGSPGWGSLLRFAFGPIGGSPLGWLLLIAALLPLLIGRRAHLAWATRYWAVAGSAWLLAIVVSRGWTGSFAPTLNVIVVPAAVSVAVAIGLGVGSFETDLSGYRFGWRQAVTAVATVAIVLGLTPVVAEAADGRWGLPGTGYAQSLSFLDQSPSAPSDRILWLGDARVLPMGGWSIEAGLAYATSEDGTPTAADLWPSGPGAATTLAGSLRAAMTDRTTHLGRLLAPAAVRYVVVLDALAPSIAGVQTATAFPAPGNLVPALQGQNDLRQVPGGQGFTVFENTAALPERAGRHGGAVSRGAPPTGADVAGWRGVLAGASGGLAFAGPVSTGTILSSYAPAGRWHLSVGGAGADRSPAFGWAAQFAVAGDGQGRLWFSGSPWLPLALVLQLVVWLVVVGALVGRRRSLDWWWGPLRRTRGRGRSGPGAG